MNYYELPPFWEPQPPPPTKPKYVRKVRPKKKVLGIYSRVRELFTLCTDPLDCYEVAEIIKCIPQQSSDALRILMVRGFLMRDPNHTTIPYKYVRNNQPKKINI